MITCLNCGESFEGNFCPNCGQKSTVQKITVPVLAEETFHFFTHLEKGFLYTTWNFIIRPGQTSLNYLAGKRKKYQKPISYFLIWTGIYIIIHNLVVNHYHYQLTELSLVAYNLRDHANALLRKHFTLFLIPLVIVSSLIEYLLLGKPRFNFPEIVAVSIFGGGTYFMMLLVSDILLGAVLKVDILSTDVFLWQAILSSLYNFWFSFDFFKRIHLRYFWVRLISGAMLTALIGWVMLEYLPIAWIQLENLI